MTPPRSRWVRAGLLLMVSACGGCMLGPDYRRPDVQIPEAWLSPVTTNAPDAFWADVYGDPVLTNLIAEALAGNRDLRVAAARVDEAWAGYTIARAPRFPSVNGAGEWTRGRTGDIPPAPGTTAERASALGLLSYELDVWGRLRRLSEAGRARALAAEDVRRTVEIGLVAAVGASYFNLRSLDAQLEIARTTLASREKSGALTRIKYDDGNGIVSELDVAQADTQIYSARSAIAALERAVALNEHALSSLLGRLPGSVPRGSAINQQALPVEVPAGLPSDLLLRRPDVRSAEQQLIAANADIGAARAACFPSVSLTAALGFESVELDNLFDDAARTWRVAPALVAPIFQGGRLRGGVRAARARHAAALATYEQAIQNAFRDVEDALVSIARLREQLAADEAVALAERRRLDLSTLRYEGGVASYSDVLDAQRFLFNAELTAVQTRANLLTQGVQLYKALGGSWFPPDAAR